MLTIFARAWNLVRNVWDERVPRMFVTPNYCARRVSRLARIMTTVTTTRSEPYKRTCEDSASRLGTDCNKLVRCPCSGAPLTRGCCLMRVEWRWWEYVTQWWVWSTARQKRVSRRCGTMRWGCGEVEDNGTRAALHAVTFGGERALICHYIEDLRELLVAFERACKDECWVRSWPHWE